jgi:hypothetical protein
LLKRWRLLAGQRSSLSTALGVNTRSQSDKAHLREVDDNSIAQRTASLETISV